MPTDNSIKYASIESWWPLDEAWEGSGLDVGYWSQQAEDWFQQRLRAIEGGSESVVTNQQWKSKLRLGRKDSIPFLANVEKLSASVL